jgi:hypothetical protein
MSTIHEMFQRMSMPPESPVGGPIQIAPALQDAS